MKVYGDVERVNLATGARFRRVVGDGESRLIREGCPETLGRQRIEYYFDERSLERIDKLIAQGRYMDTQANLHVADDAGGSTLCAHSRVVAKTAKRDDGFIEGYWQCDSCEAKFIPERPALESVDTRKALEGEMRDMTPMSKDSSLMIEWEEFKARGEYANAVNWGTYPSASIEMSEDGKGEVGITLHYDHIEGSMWAAFCAGWYASIPMPNPHPTGKSLG